MPPPSQSTLALYAGKDLGWFAAKRAERHVARCRECRQAVEAFAALHDDLVGFVEVPALSWSRLAAEMKANIRLGLAAGECVRGERTTGRVASFGFLSGARTLTACASAMALVAAGLLLQRPNPAPQPAATGDSAVWRATANGIELNQGGRTLSLLHAPSGDVTYSAGAQGSMRASYVDSDTGNMTINNLYDQ